MGSAGKLAVALIALVVAGALFFVLREDESPEATPTTAASESQTSGDGKGNGDSADDEPKPEPEPPDVATIVIEGGQPVGGVQELTFAKGDEIRFVVESDVADHVHLHGYDVFQDVAAGGTAKFEVPATIEGIFEAELEDSVVPIAEITVEPS